MFRLLLKVAFASLWQRKSRTFAAMIMISVSLWGLMTLEGIYEGMIEQMINNAIRSDAGDLSIYGQGYRLDPNLAHRIRSPDVLLKRLATDSRVRSLVTRVQQEGLIATSRYAQGCWLVGVSLAAEQAHGRLGDYLIAGDYHFGPQDRKAILGVKLAEKLNVEVGHKVVISVQGAGDEMSGVALRVGGIVRTNNLGIDGRLVLMEQAGARSVLGVEQGVTMVSVMLKERTSLAAVQASLSQAFPKLEILRWDQRYPALLQSEVLISYFNGINSLLVFSVAALGIFGVLLVSVLERIREFGIMLALGAGFRFPACQILLESLLIGLTGYLGGILLGGSTLYYFHTYGLDLTQFSGGLEALGMDAVIYAMIRGEYFLMGLLAVVLATLISVIPPLRILYRAKPVEAINRI